MLRYADGGPATANRFLANWLTDQPTANGARIAVPTDHRVTPSGPADFDLNYRLYVNTVPVDPARELHSVTLPANSALHILDPATRRCTARLPGALIHAPSACSVQMHLPVRV